MEIRDRLKREFTNKNFSKKISNIDNYMEYKEYYTKCDMDEFKDYFTLEEFKNVIHISMFFDKYDLFFKYFNKIKKDEEIIVYALRNINLTKELEEKLMPCIDEEVIDTLIYIHNYIPINLLKNSTFKQLLKPYIHLLDFDKLELDYLDELISVLPKTLVKSLSSKNRLFLLFSEDISNHLSYIVNNKENRLLLLPSIELKIKEFFNTCLLTDDLIVKFMDSIIINYIKEYKISDIAAINKFFDTYARYIPNELVSLISLKYNYVPLNKINWFNDEIKKSVLNLDYLKLNSSYILEIYSFYKNDKEFMEVFEIACPFYNILTSDIGSLEYEVKSYSFEVLNKVFFNDNIFNKVKHLFNRTKNNDLFKEKTKHCFYNTKYINDIYDLYPLSLQIPSMINYFKFICNYRGIVLDLSYASIEEIDLLKSLISLIESDNSITDYYTYYGLLYFTIRKYFDLYVYLMSIGNLNTSVIKKIISIESQRLGFSFEPKSIGDLVSYDEKLNNFCDENISINNAIYDIKNFILIRYFRIKYFDLKTIINKYSYDIEFQDSRVKKIYNDLLFIYNSVNKKELIDYIGSLDYNYDCYRNVDDELKEIILGKYCKEVEPLYKLEPRKTHDFSDRDFKLFIHVSLKSENKDFNFNEKFRGFCYGLIGNENLSYFRSLKKDITSIWGYLYAYHKDILMVGPTDLYSNETLNTEFFYDEKNCKYYPVNSLLNNCYLVHNEVVLSSRRKNKLLKPQAIISIDEKKSSDIFYSWHYNVPLIFIDSVRTLEREKKKISISIELFKQNHDELLGRNIILRIITLMKHYNNDNIKGKYDIHEGYNLIIDILENVKKYKKKNDDKDFDLLVRKSLFEDNSMLMMNLDNKEIIKLLKLLDTIRYGEEA